MPAAQPITTQTQTADAEFLDLRQLQEEMQALQSQRASAETALSTAKAQAVDASQLHEAQLANLTTLLSKANAALSASAATQQSTAEELAKVRADANRTAQGIERQYAQTVEKLAAELESARAQMRDTMNATSAEATT